jgi:hypothetical protein
MEKTPDNLAQVMSERLDDPSKRAQNRPEDDTVREGLGYAKYLFFVVAPAAYQYGFRFFVPLLVLLGVVQVLSVWNPRLKLWSAGAPTKAGWMLLVVGLLLGLPYVIFI